jgi:hypothetical protein
MSEVLIHETRGKLVEAIYRGDAVVINSGNSIVAECGDIQKFTYLRSAAMQILHYLNLLKPEEYVKLQSFHIRQNLNDDLMVVGTIKPVFKMLSVI